MTINKYKLLIAYDGTHYHGWQIQSNGTSIQALIEQALQTVLREQIKVVGSGRTDTGVHAKGQVAHFTSSKPLPHQILFSLNALLPTDIRIKEIAPVPLDFHARFHALSKIYHYHLHLDKVPDPFKKLYSTHILHPVDLSLLKKAAALFLGPHDFTSFANEADRGSAAQDPIRTLMRLDVVGELGGVRLEFEADGFLYKMVRNITGSLLDVANGRISLEEIPKIFQAKDRKQAARTAPPEGLFLVQVIYN